MLNVSSSPFDPHATSGGLECRSAAVSRRAEVCYPFSETREPPAVNRRSFITILGGAAAWLLAARAQQQSKVWRIGVLSIGSAATARHLVEAFFKGMADLGYQEGRNVRYEVRYGEGSIERFEQYAREHVDAKVDL